MKLLMSLILIITIAFNCCKSFNLGTNKIDYSKIENQANQQQCFKSSGDFPTGYESSYVLLSFNGNYPNPNGGIQQSSFLESGFINIDFISEQLYVDFILDNGSGTKTKGNLWGFSGNSTQYVNINVNGTDYCFQQPLMFSVPNLDGLKYVGDFEIGTVQCDTFVGHPDVQSNSTNSVLLVDKSDCSFISGSTENINGTPSGYTLTNFYYYKPSADPSYFKLPSICLNQPSTSKLTIKSFSTKLPKIIESFQF